MTKQVKPCVKDAFKNYIRDTATADNRLGDKHNYTQEERMHAVALFAQSYPDDYREWLTDKICELHPMIIRDLTLPSSELPSNIVSRENLAELMFAAIRYEINKIEEMQIEKYLPQTIEATRAMDMDAPKVWYKTRMYREAA